jgi:hypothetical protein
MSYWLGVYLLVAVSVAVPFLLLYLFGLVMWLTVTAIGSMMQSLTDALRKDFSRGHGSTIWRRAA